MDYKVFYSWQSDLPNATNRGFILRALEKAAETVAKDETVGIAPVVDRDTQGVPGSPDIGATIFAKVDKAQVFVADVSVVNPGAEGRLMPNPNVMLELGYAAKALGWDRIVMVMNSAYGRIEDLPFDLRMKRVVTYSAREGEEDRSAERKLLTGVFEDALRAMAHHRAPAEAAGGVPITPKGLADIAIEAVESAAPNRTLQVRRFMDDALERLHEVAPAWAESPELDEQLVSSLDRSLPVVVDFARVAAGVAALGDEPCARELFRKFEPIVNRYDLPREFSGSYRETDFDFYKFIGHELFVILTEALIREERLELLEGLLSGSLRLTNSQASRDVAAASVADLSTYVELLDFRTKRLGLNRLSLRADLLNERHSKGELAEHSPIEEFAEADYFLFLWGEMANRIDNIWIRWIPWSVLYMRSVPRLLVDAERLPSAEKLARVLGAPNVEAMKEMMAARVPKLRELYRTGFWQYAMDRFKIESIGSK